MVSCLILATLVALLRLAFATAPSVSDLTLPQKLTRWLILQKARRHTLNNRSCPIVLRPVVSVRFQVLFHSPHRGSFHLSFTVLVHYRSSNVFSLGKWASQLPTELACSAVLRCSARVCSISLTGLSPSMACLSRHVLLSNNFVTPNAKSYNPIAIKTMVWANSLSLATTQEMISFPGVT